MSILHPEEHRECRLCGRQWHAERYISKPSLMPALNYGTALSVARVAQAQQSLAGWEKYTHCPDCGTSKVRTLKKGKKAKVKNTGPSPFDTFWQEMKTAWNKGMGR